jgi:hypothetical protein
MKKIKKYQLVMIFLKGKNVSKPDENGDDVIKKKFNKIFLKEI